MTNKTIKKLIGLFFGLILLLVALVVVDYYSTVTPVPNINASAAARVNLTQAAYGQPEPIPLQTGAMQIPESAAPLVKGRPLVSAFPKGTSDYKGVAQRPADASEALTQLAGGKKKKPAPVPLSETDLQRKVGNAGGEKKELPLTASNVPGLGEQTGPVAGEAYSKIIAPVDYLLIKTPAAWKAFTTAHKSYFPKIDFEKQDAVILVSVSELPSCIFKIDRIKKATKETVVFYRVDPLAMSAGAEENERASYSSVAVPKNTDVRLEQIR